MFFRIHKAKQNLIKFITKSNQALLDGIKTHNLEKVRTSLENGADPNTKDKELNQKALGLASCYCSKDIVLLLLKHPKLKQETLLYAIASTRGLITTMYFAEIKSAITKEERKENVQLLEAHLLENVDQNNSVPAAAIGSQGPF